MVMRLGGGLLADDHDLAARPGEGREARQLPQEAGVHCVPSTERYTQWMFGSGRRLEAFGNELGVQLRKGFAPEATQRQLAEPR